MASKGSALMKNAQVQKTRQTVQQFVEWYSKKEEFYKVYLPIQQTIIKRILNAVQTTFNRLRQIAQIMADEKDLQATIFQKTQKNVLSDETKFQPKVEQLIDPSDLKASKVKKELPTWSNNVDRVLLSLSKQQKEKQGRIKKIFKILETIQESILKQQGKYKGEVKKFQKDLETSFNKIDEFEKEQSKTLGKMIKQNKSNDIKDSAYFIGEIKKLEKDIMAEIELFATRGKITLDMVQAILKWQKDIAKKIKEELVAFKNYRQSILGVDLKGEQEIWGQVALIQEKIDVERVTYFNKALLKPERIEDLKKILANQQLKNNWQVIVMFLQTKKQGLSEIIKAKKSIQNCLKNISYRCWQGIAIAQGWLIESYTPSVMYMTYDSIMLIYSLEGECLKKIHTSSSKISRVEDQILFLQQKIKGFFSDSIEEYKIKFEQAERLEQFQLFIQNQIG